MSEVLKLASFKYDQEVLKKLRILGKSEFIVVEPVTRFIPEVGLGYYVPKN